MQKFLSALLGLGLVAMPAMADTLPEALVKAYQSSPRLQAAQAELRSIDNQVAGALAGWRPTVQGEASVSRQQTTRNDPVNNGDVLQPKNVGVTLQQPLFRGFRTVGATRAAKAQVMAGRANLLNTEQQLLLETATAYVNVYRDQAVLGLNKSNEQVLQKQLEATQDRFRVGEVTRTDVAQAESRLARANADRIQAEANLASSQANYQRLVGNEPQDITKPVVEVPLPTDMADAIQQAEMNSPSVEAAEFGLDRAKNDVTVSRGALLPEVNLVAQAERGWDQSFIRSGKTDTTSVGVQATIPLYTGGADYARTRAAKQTVGARQQELDEAVRRARENAITAWQQLMAARAAIVSRQSQTQSAELALEGVKQEANVGTRTTLDVLNSEQELLDAKVSMVRAERDLIVATFETMAATGKLNARNLALPVTYYNPLAYYDENAESWFGLGD